jgi:hypothetical protein
MRQRSKGVRHRCIPTSISRLIIAVNPCLSGRTKSRCIRPTSMQLCLEKRQFPAEKISIYAIRITGNFISRSDLYTHCEH